MKKPGFCFQIDFKFLFFVKETGNWSLKCDLLEQNTAEPVQGCPQRNGLGPASKYVERMYIF